MMAMECGTCRELVRMLRELIEADPIKRCASGYWSAADAVNYQKVRRAEELIARVERSAKPVEDLDVPRKLQERVAILEARIAHAQRIVNSWVGEPLAIMKQAFSALSGNHKCSSNVAHDVYSGTWDGTVYDEKYRRR